MPVSTSPGRQHGVDAFACGTARCPPKAGSRAISFCTSSLEISRQCHCSPPVHRAGGFRPPARSPSTILSPSRCRAAGAVWCPGEQDHRGFAVAPEIHPVASCPQSIRYSSTPRPRFSRSTCCPALQPHERDRHLCCGCRIEGRKTSFSNGLFPIARGKFPISFQLHERTGR